MRTQTSAGVEDAADLVADGDAALFDDGDRPDPPAVAAKLRQARVEQRHGMGCHGPRRQAVGEHEHQVVSARHRGEPRPRGVVEATPEIRAGQIGRPVGGSAVQLHRFEAAFAEAVDQRARVERLVDRIPGPGMGQLEGEVIAGRDGRARPRQADPRGCRSAHPRPGIIACRNGHRRLKR